MYVIVEAWSQLALNQYDYINSGKIKHDYMINHKKKY